MSGNKESCETKDLDPATSCFGEHSRIRLDLEANFQKFIEA